MIFIQWIALFTFWTTGAWSWVCLQVSQYNRGRKQRELVTFLKKLGTRTEQASSNHNNSSGTISSFNILGFRKFYKLNTPNNIDYNTVWKYFNILEAYIMSQDTQAHSIATVRLLIQKHETF